MKKMALILALVLSLTFLGGCGGGNADKESHRTDENWPNDSITLIVPWKAGGGGDVSARLVAKYLSENLGSNIIVDNREGGSGMVGTSYFYGMKQDGSYLLFNSEPFYSNNILENNATFTQEDLAILATYIIDPACIAIIPNERFGNFDEFNAYIQENPGVVKIGLNGGSSGVILVKLLMDYYNWDVKLVYYSTASEMHAAIMGNHIDALTTTSSAGVESTPIILASNERIEKLPDATTYEEMTGNELTLGTTRYFAVSAEFKENYPDRYQVLVDALKATLTSDEYIAAVEESGMGSVAVYYGPEESMQISKEMFGIVEKYSDLMKNE